MRGTTTKQHAYSTYCKTDVVVFIFRISHNKACFRRDFSQDAIAVIPNVNF